MNELLVDSIVILDAGFLSIAFISYILAYFGKNTKVQDYKKEE